MNIVATYEYVDEAGELLFQVCRTEDKRFLQRVPDGNGGFDWGLGQTRRVLYRLPRVLEAVAAGETIYVVEGEKDALAIEAAGGVATCNPMGAGKWTDDHSESLMSARRVVVVADRDEPGVAHAHEVAKSLAAVGVIAEIVQTTEGKDAADHLATGHTLDEFVPLAEIVRLAARSTLPELLLELVAFVRRFVVLSEAQATALALWIVHTHAIEAADTTAYLWIASALKRSGKSRLLEVLKLLVRSPLSTANISDAALFRAIAELTPTLLFDEVDAIFGPKARDREDLRGLLNAGYERGAVTHRMGGSRMTTLETFSVFGCKALAGIGKLPDTISDRAILIQLERKTRDERVERFRRRDVAPQAEDLRERVAAWAEPQLDKLRAARPQLPDELDDRAQDIWEPLFTIADLAGGDWPTRARGAAIALAGNGNREDDSLTARLLADIRYVFEVSEHARLRTADLIAALAEIEESPWGDWHGKTITAQALSRLLQPFRIKTMAVKVAGETVRGYKREQFADAWHRVLGVTGVTSVTSGSAPHAGSNAGNAGNASGTGDARVVIPEYADPALFATAEEQILADSQALVDAGLASWIEEPGPGEGVVQETLL